MAAQEGTAKGTVEGDVEGGVVGAGESEVLWQCQHGPELSPLSSSSS